MNDTTFLTKALTLNLQLQKKYMDEELQRDIKKYSSEEAIEELKKLQEYKINSGIYNITPLSDFISLCKATVDAEQDYESSLNSDNQNNSKKKPKDPSITTPIYKKVYEKHFTEDHPFYDILNSSPIYIDLKNKFLNKNVFINRTFIAPDLKYLDDPNYPNPLPTIFFLNLFIAQSIEMYENIKQNGVAHYLVNSKVEKKEQHIARLAQRLYDELNDDEIYDDIGSHTHNKIKAIANGELRKKGAPNSKSIYSISKNHDKAIREIFIKHLVHEYSKLFVIQVEKIQLNKSMRTVNITPRLKLFDCNSPQEAIPTLQPNTYWKPLKGRIHADILVGIIQLITNDDPIEERAVQKIREKFFDTLNNA